jgi:isocitrate/isopropylmalate dehydrogenase
MNTTHRIAVMPGDGIGGELVPEGPRIPRAGAARVERARQHPHVRLRKHHPRTRDMGGRAATIEVGEAVARRVATIPARHAE